jgi:hypothetical protein
MIWVVKIVPVVSAVSGESRMVLFNRHAIQIGLVAKPADVAEGPATISLAMGRFAKQKSARKPTGRRAYSA